MARKLSLAHDTLSIWLGYRNRRLTEGASLWRVAQEVARDSGYSVRTAYLYLNPDARARDHESKRKSNRRMATKRKQRRTYIRNYLRVCRHVNSYIPSVFSSCPEASLEQLSESLAEFCEGVRFPLKTVERILYLYQLGQIQGRIRGPPYLTQISPGTWQYSSKE